MYKISRTEIVIGAVGRLDPIDFISTNSSFSSTLSHFSQLSSHPLNKGDPPIDFSSRLCTTITINIRYTNYHLHEVAIAYHPNLYGACVFLVGCVRFLFRILPVLRAVGSPSIRRGALARTTCHWHLKVTFLTMSRCWLY